MPELPEVESIRRKLEPHLIGATINKVELLLPRQLATPAPSTFRRKLSGARIERSLRIGKYLFYELSSGGFLHFHLRMTGRLLLTSEPPKYARCKFSLDTNEILWYDDTRTLGVIAWYPKLPESVAALRDAVTGTYDAKWLYDELHKRTCAVKDVLLDQTVLAGIGNIYACEIAFLAGVSPFRKSNQVTKAESGKLHSAIHQILQAAIDAEGTTFSDYRGADGKPGNFQLQLAVYDRAGEMCPRCKSTIEKAMFHQRGTYFCPKCQK